MSNLRKSQIICNIVYNQNLLCGVILGVFSMGCTDLI